MAYIFNEESLPKLKSVIPGRTRTFFVSKELSNTDDMLCGITEYDSSGKSPYHFHENCEHFYLILEGQGITVTETEERKVKKGDLVFFPSNNKHMLKADGVPLKFFEYQTPNRFKTTIIDGDDTNLKWEKIDGKIWVQS